MQSPYIDIGPTSLSADQNMVSGARQGSHETANFKRVWRGWGVMVMSSAYLFVGRVYQHKYCSHTKTFAI